MDVYLKYQGVNAPTYMYTWKSKFPTFRNANVLYQIENPIAVEHWLDNQSCVSPIGVGKVGDTSLASFMFKLFVNFVWIEEVWFYLKHIKEKLFSIPSLETMAWQSQSAASTIPIREEAGGKSIPSHSSKTQRRYPDDAVHHKNHIPKVMFLLATAEPHIKPGPVQSFSSCKIGIWPFVQYVEAKRSSIKRPRGTGE